MRKIAVIVVIFVFAALASAQIPTSGNVFFGYSYYNTDITGGRNGLNGWEGSVEGKLLPLIGVVVDVSGHYGSESPSVCTVAVLDCGRFEGSVSQHNFLAGPRISASVGKFRPFAEVLIGAAHINFHIAGPSTSFATAVGGGLDYKLVKLLAWRFQADYIHSHLFDMSQNNVRVSTGIVLRF